MVIRMYHCIELKRKLEEKTAQLEKTKSELEETKASLKRCDEQMKDTMKKGMLISCTVYLNIMPS